MSALRRAEDIARAPNLQVAHRDFEPRAERRVLLDRVDPLPRFARAHHVARQHEIRVGLVLRAPDAPAELIQIGQSKAIRAVDDDGVRVRNIEAALDDRRRDEHVRFARDESLHDRLQFVLVHLPVPDFDTRAGHQFADASRDFFDRVDAVVQKINLPLPRQFALDRIADDPLVVGTDQRLDRDAVRRRRLDCGHVLRADE